VNATSKQLAEENTTIDKMYMKGHTDVWCKEHCDPNNKPDLEKVCPSAISVLLFLIVLD